MAPQKKKTEQQKGPKLYEVVIGAILSLILGGLLAVIYLVLQPVEEVAQFPPEEAREKGKVYFKPGQVGRAGEFNWRPKQAAFEAGASGTIELVEQEINQWVSVEFSDLEDEDYPDAGMFFIAPRSLNFRVGDGRFQIASDLDWTVFGYTHTLKAHAIGTFVRGNGSFAFEPEEMYIGGFTVPRTGDFGPTLIRRVVEVLDPSQDLRESWAAVSEVSIVEDQLILEIP